MRLCACSQCPGFAGATFIVFASVAGASPAWTGDGDYRVVVTVPPVALDGRDHDQLIASLAVDFIALHRELGVEGNVDLDSIQVHQFDPGSGAAIPFPPFETQRTPFDRPWRFDDPDALDDFPDRAGSASHFDDGRVPANPRSRALRLFNRELTPGKGQLIWTHDQSGQADSNYCVYWRMRTDGNLVNVSPAPWLGDVDLYRLPDAQPLAGFAHLSVTTGDVNNDGLFDLAAGVEKGEVMLFLNRGRVGAPLFQGCILPRDEEGPIDCGWYAAPLLYDWDADGAVDLLCGTARNVILWWKNVSTGDALEFSYRGFLNADGARLEVPQSPVEEDQAGIFKVDYYNQPCICDWNVDGLPDLITGGYTTGRIFLYISTGRDPQGIPILHYEGPVLADGDPIDTGWAASPLAYDFDGDGLLELISGSWAKDGDSGATDYLTYFENEGTPQKPALVRRPFPKSGAFPPGIIARGSTADWNADGLVDLIVSDNSGEIYFHLNRGSNLEPNWQFDRASQLTAPWAFARVSLLASPTYDGVAAASPSSAVSKLFLSGARFERLEGSPHLPRIRTDGAAHAGGKPIAHPSPPYGDPYNWNVPHDWDGDGAVDILSCTFQGNVFFHRNIGTPRDPAFDSGVPFTLNNGEWLKVGPPVYDDKSQVHDFTELQGSRAQCLVADFDGDGIDDLAVTETYGNVWIFRNAAQGVTNALSPGEPVFEMPARATIAAIDWNEDGLYDIITGRPEDDPGTVYINRSAAGTCRFDEPAHPFTLPYVFWGANLFPEDWNRDGDTDFLIRSEFYLFWAEKSFLEHGYRPATIVGPAERRP